MTLRLEDKKVIIDEVNLVARDSISAIGAEYRGLTVAQMTELRNSARDANIVVRVVRNTLARIAMTGTRFECLKPSLKGPLVLAFSKDDPGAPARLMKDFSKKYENLKVQLIAIDGQIIDAKRLDHVANLPTKLQAISQLMSVMKAPIQKLVGTLAAPHTKLVRTVVAIKDQKQSEAK